MHKRPKYQDRLTAYTLGIAGCGAALATGADAAVVDVTFAFGPTLDQSDGANSSSAIIGASAGNIGWFTAYDMSEPGGTEVSLFAPEIGGGEPSGFYHNSGLGINNLGLVTYGDTGTPQTFGNATLPNGDGTNTAYFSATNPALDLGENTSGVVGFRSDAGNWGYIEFQWDEAANTLTVLSAKVETVPDTPITFTPIPEPSVMGLLSLGATGLLLRRRRSAK